MLFNVFVLFLLTQSLVMTTGVPLKPTNCTLFSKVTGGHEAIEYIMVSCAYLHCCAMLFLLIVFIGFGV